MCGARHGADVIPVGTPGYVSAKQPLLAGGPGEVMFEVGAGAAPDMPEAAQAEITRLREALDAARADNAALKAELEAQRHFMDRIIAHAPIGIGFMDHDLVFRMANPALARFLGLDREAMLGKHVFALLPEAEPQFGGIMRQVLESGTAFTTDAAPFVYELDGEKRVTYWDYTYAAVPDGAGRPAGILVANIEVSARIQLLEIMRDQVDRLRELDRLKTDFINAASHELRTPLTSVIGYTDFLAEGVGGALTPDQQRYVAQISKGAARLRRLVEDLLDVALMEAGTFQVKPAPADLAWVVRDVVESLRPQAQAASVALRVEIAHAPLPTVMDPARIGQAVLNLVTNAIKFTPAGGTVVVRASEHEGRRRVEVRDEGPGVTAELHQRVFEKFFRGATEGSRPAPGAGLGLAIAKGLVEAHGGSIGLDSTPGRGASFWLDLPEAATPAAESRSPR